MIEVFKGLITFPFDPPTNYYMPGTRDVDAVVVNVQFSNDGL